METALSVCYNFMGFWLRVPQDCPLEAAQLIAECLSIDPVKRPSAKDIVIRLMAMAEDVHCSPRPSLAGSSRGSFPSSPSHAEPNSFRDHLHMSKGLETLLSPGVCRGESEKAPMSSGTASTEVASLKDSTGQSVG
jgi:hypothetical protein